MYRRHVRARTRLITRNTRRFVLHHVLHADDPPERLARGVAIGMFCGILPVFGFQSVAVILMAWLLRANKVVGLPLTWISNPFTFVVIYYPSYVVGALMLGDNPVDVKWFRELANPPAGWWEAIEFYWTRMEEVFWPFWLGSTMVGLLLGLLTYYIVFNVVRGYRLRRWGRLMPPTAIQPIKIKSDAA